MRGTMLRDPPATIEAMQSVWAAKVFGDRVDPRIRLQRIFGGEVTAGSPPAPALEWARPLVAEGTGDGDVVRAVAMLRRAEPRLTLRAATYLASHAVR